MRWHKRFQLYFSLKWNITLQKRLAIFPSPAASLTFFYIVSPTTGLKNAFGPQLPNFSINLLFFTHKCNKRVKFQNCFSLCNFHNIYISRSKDIRMTILICGCWMCSCATLYKRGAIKEKRNVHFFCRWNWLHTPPSTLRGEGRGLPLQCTE
jgi:hypothetical protein